MNDPFYRQPAFWKWFALPISVILAGLIYAAKLVTGF